MKHFLSIFSAFLLISGAAEAKPETYSFDKSHTSILFFIDHLGFTKVVGEFMDYDGTVVFDQEKVENSKVNVTFRPAGVKTDVAKLDEHLQAPGFFDTAKYPTATFVSTKMERTGKNTGKVTGDLTLLGVTKPVTLDVTFNKAGEISFIKEYHAGFSARGKLFRSAFKMMEGLPMV
ncbi:MAG: YceI family protein, partial [Dongiaceae bacterium]